MPQLYAVCSQKHIMTTATVQRTMILKIEVHTCKNGRYTGTPLVLIHITQKFAQRYLIHQFTNLHAHIVIESGCIS